MRIILPRARQIKQTVIGTTVKSKINNNTVEDKVIKGNANIGDILAISKDNEDMIGTQKATSIDNNEGIKIRTNVEEKTISILNEVF